MDEAIWIATAFVLGLAVRPLGLPPLVGYLAAGFALSAAGVSGGALLEQVAHLGVLLLLFSVGLKVRLRNVVRPEVWASALAHLAISGVVLGAALHALFGLAWQTALVAGIALGFSSTVVAAKVLEEKGELRAFHGRVAIGILIVQDIVAVALLSAVDAHAPSPLLLALLGLPLLRPLLHRLLEASGHGELLVLYGLLLALALGGLGFEYLGLSAELGALVLGAMLADHPRAGELADGLWSLKEVFLVGFFLQIGMAGIPGAQSLLIAGLLALLLPAKAALFFLLLVRLRLRARSAFLAGLGLATYSEFGLVVAQLLRDKGWLGAQWLVLFALTVALSFVIATPMNRMAHALYERWERRLCAFESPTRHPDDEPISLGSAQILIMGMGRVGTGAYDFLTGRRLRVVGMDSDPGKVHKHVHAGRRVLYADAEDSGFWQRLDTGGLRAVLLAMPDLEAKKIAATRLRRHGYRGLVTATNMYPEEVDVILAAGVDSTFNYFEEAGVGFAEHAWEALQARG